MIQLDELLENPTIYTEELKKDLPFLFPNNDVAKAQWHLKFIQFQANSQNIIQRLKKSLQRVDILKPTKERLEKLLSAHMQREQEIKSLFHELGLQAVESENLKKLLANRIPSRQHVESYYLNVFRDWSWGETENAYYNQIAGKADHDSGYFLVLGGGAGRLSYDLCQIYDHWNVVQLDINPLLSLIGHKMSSGQKFKLTEVAAEPLSNDHLFAERELQGMGEVPDSRLRYLVGDASNPPFKDASFDGVFTPWLIDIIPEPFESFSRRLNRLLKDSGEWISFGPLSFERQKAYNQFTSEEVLAQLKHAGFEHLESGWTEVPYLQSPIRAQVRREKIFWFRAKKTKPCKQPPRYHYYPDWFENPNMKVPLASTNIETLFSQKNLEANVLNSFIQGQSITDMINNLTGQAGMNPEEAESLIVGTVNTLLENGEIVSK